MSIPWYTDPTSIALVIVSAILAFMIGFAIVQFRQRHVFPWREKCADAVAHFSAYGLDRAAKIAKLFGTGNKVKGLDKLFELLDDLFGGKDAGELVKEIRGVASKVARSKDGLAMLKQVIAEAESSAPQQKQLV